MKHTSKTLSILIAAGVSLSLLLALPQGVAAQGFNEQFSSPTLDPAWQVVTYTGPFPRSHGFTSPANDYSLAANPGHLRYLLNPMTHPDGYLNNYQTTFSQHSCCNHDFGLELHRMFSDDHWIFEAKATYFLPPSNGRSLELRLYFGDGGPGTFWVLFQRARDIPDAFTTVSLLQERGPSLYSDRVGLEFFRLTDRVDLKTLHWRLHRAGGQLEALLSEDGVNWTTAFSRDMGSQLDGLGQRLVITGLSWFNSAGSYADYDYVSVTPTAITVDIDIKPGSDPNSINPNSKGTTPVAILTTSSFDAAGVNAASVFFGKTGTESPALKAAMEDVDGDGDLDMILHFSTQATGIICGTTSATVTGQTNDGRSIKGTDSVNTTGCK